MADYFNNPMPLDGAHFVENPAKVTVERVARAIEYDAALADAYKQGNFFNNAQNIRRAFELSREFRGGVDPETGKALPSKARTARSVKAKLQKTMPRGKKGSAEAAAFKAAVDAEVWGGNPPVKNVTVGEGGRKAIAAAIGRARGYVKSNIRNRGHYLNAYGTVSGLKQGVIATRKWGSNRGLPGWKFGVSIPKDSVFGRNRPGGSLMKFGTGARSANKAKQQKLVSLAKQFNIQQADGSTLPWWNAANANHDTAAKDFLSWRKGQRNSARQTPE